MKPFRLICHLKCYGLRMISSAFILRVNVRTRFRSVRASPRRARRLLNTWRPSADRRGTGRGWIYRYIWAILGAKVMHVASLLGSLFTFGGSKPSHGHAVSSRSHSAKQEASDKKCPHCGRTVRQYNVTDGDNSWSEYFCYACNVAVLGRS
jgi:hypothetical protein